MSIITIDLGTTNTKVTRFSRNLEVIATESSPIAYMKEGDFAEFSPKEYLDDISRMIAHCAEADSQDSIEEINITGQAETLVVLDKDGTPLLPIISWLDNRSRKECEELEERFGDACYSITGQPEFIPTWPVTKILWLRRNRPDIFSKAARFLLLQDYVIYYLTGRYTTDYTIAGFSCYFNITKKEWWKDILDYVGIKPSQLPEIVKPNTIVGTVIRDIAGIDRNTKVNSGLLDHFAGMIGTGNTEKGIVSESAGTVLSLAAFVDAPIADSGIPTYCGPFDGTYALLPVCESGGICLQWFRDTFMKDMTFREIDSRILESKPANPPVFLPYIAGTNSPSFDRKAKGVFFGLTNATAGIDCAYAVMEGVACLLRENVEYLESKGIRIDRIISTGGGAKSEVWTQLKSNFTDREIAVPENEEAPSLGAAILSAVNCGYFSSLDQAIKASVRIGRTYKPEDTEEAGRTFRLYREILCSLRNAFGMYAGK